MEYSMAEIGATQIWTLGIIVLHIITVTSELIIYLINQNWKSYKNLSKDHINGSDGCIFIIQSLF